MSDKKERKEFDTWARKIIQKYQPILLVSDHTFDIEFKEKLARSSLFEHSTMYPYKTCYIMYGETAMMYWKEGNKEELRQGLIHELCHDITDPMYVVASARYATEDQLLNERERLTDHIANIIVHLKV